jgi:4-diphosphocytidyl-2-C-methyl-D-erythritol kinase
MTALAQELLAPAKINLFLRILAREDSGFHQLETLFVSLSFGDLVSLAPTSSGITLTTSGYPVGPGEENLAFRAAQAFFDEAGAEGGVRIHLEKNVPPGTGLGGGSSDAASTLKGLFSMYPGVLDFGRLLELAVELGSDVPYFLSPSPLTLAWGRGERLFPLPPLPPTPVLLALPSVSVNTQEAYESLALERRRSPSPFQRPEPRILGSGEVDSWEAIGKVAENDFEPVVFGMHPSLRRLRQALDARDPVCSLLSGSGSALFALFSNETSAREAQASLSAEFQDARFLVTWTASGPRTP